TYGKELAVVHRPKRLSFSNFRFGFLNTYYFTFYFQVRAIRRAVKNLTFQPDLVYCHFLSSALYYYGAFPQSKLPIYVAVGEYYNIDKVRRRFSPQFYSKLVARVNGYIAVSPQVQQKLISLGVPNKKIIVEPNGVDLSAFKPQDKIALRKKHGLPLHKKLVLFIGRFIENKGPLRLQNALDQLDDNVGAIFLGKGPQRPNHPKIVYSGVVAHHLVPEMMGAADVFVLPTLHEGSSNVIVEAMATGLPIISSDIPEIRFQCQPEYAILVNPKDTNAIAAALDLVLGNDGLREQMGQK